MEKIAEECEKFALDRATIGQRVRLVKIDGEINPIIEKRLMELGFVPECEIVVQKHSLLDDVILININGYMLSVRKDIAKYIIVRGVNKYA